jgi:hypothetical protein
MPEYCPRCDRAVYFAEEIIALSFRSIGTAVSEEKIKM